MTSVVNEEASPVPDPPRRSWAASALLAAVLVIHVVQSVSIFPTTRAFRDDEHPVLLVDHAIHLYHGALGSQFLREHGTTWGYDPFFMAGYPETPVWDSSSNLSILFQALAGGGYHPRAYNIGLLVCSILAVAAIPAGAAAAGLKLPETALATLLGWLYFQCGWPCWLWRSGLFAFITASGGLVLLLGLLVRFEHRPGAGGVLALGGVSTAFVYAHVTAPILALGGLVGFLATTARRHSWRWLSMLAAAGLFALLVNLVWLVPLWRFRGIRAPRAFFLAPTTAWFVVESYLKLDADGLLGLALLALGTAGLVVWIAEGRRVRAATFGGAAAVCLGLTFFGGLWIVTRTLEPLRFMMPLHLLLAVPAGTALVTGTTRVARALGGGRRGAWLAAGAWLILLATIAVCLPETMKEMGRALTLRWPRPLVAGVRPEMVELVHWLGANTDPSARILFEDQLRLYEKTDPESTHWTPLLPILLGPQRRQFIGGVYHMAFITHHRAASFGDFQLGGRPIDAWRPQELRSYCELYNIGWVVCWSPLSRFVFDRWPDAQLVAVLPRFHTPRLAPSYNEHQWGTLLARGGPEVAAQYTREGDGRYVIYRVARPHSFFLAGEGQVSRVDYNRLELTGLVPKDGAVVLSLHWLDTWRTDPPLPVDPVPIPDDPVPFIRISTDKKLDRLLLYNAYED
jgi:hypothetical protein